MPNKSVQHPRTPETRQDSACCVSVDDTDASWSPQNAAVTSTAFPESPLFVIFDGNRVF
jgi:hypothetical protein